MAETLKRFNPYPPGVPPRRPTTQDVAARAGVSVGTVSNYLNRPEIVAAATAMRISDAVRALGFVPNRSAAQLRGGHSGLLGVVVTDVGNPFWGSVVRGIEEGVDGPSLGLIVASTYQDVARETAVIRTLAERGVDGLIIAPVGPESSLGALLARQVPVVLFDRASRTGIPSVVANDELGGRLAAAHLFGLGHTRIASVNGPTGISWCQARRRGARRAARQAGLDPTTSIVEIVVPELSIAHGEAAAGALGGATAAFCANDLVALGLLRGLRQLGIAVPGQISLVGYDDAEFASALDPALTTVRQSPEAMGAAAARLLVSSRDTNDVPRCVRFTPELVVRASSAPPMRGRRSLR